MRPPSPRCRASPRTAIGNAAHLLEQIANDYNQPFQIPDDHRAGVLEGLTQARRGGFASDEAVEANGAKPKSWFWALVHSWWLRRAWEAHKPHAFADTRIDGKSSLVNIEPVEGQLDLWKAVGENRFFTGDQINCIGDMMGFTGIPSSRSK